MYSEFLESKKVEPFWSRFGAVLGSGKKPFLSGPSVNMCESVGNCKSKKTRQKFWRHNKKNKKRIKYAYICNRLYMQVEVGVRLHFTGTLKFSR